MSKRSERFGSDWWTEVTVVRQREYNDNGPFCFGNLYEDGTLNAVINSLLVIRESIPVEYQDKASCEITSHSGYDDSSSAEITVNYCMPETSEETVRREFMENKIKNQSSA